jgi:pyruvate kinase
VEIIAAEPDVATMVSILIKESLATGLVTDSDTVTIVHGFMSGVSGTTNTIQVLNVKEYLALSNHPT